jgi:hypothetical protein
LKLSVGAGVAAWVGATEVGEGVAAAQLVPPSVPARKISRPLLLPAQPVPLTIPSGCLYQSRMLVGSPLMKGARTCCPTSVPKALIEPPPPLAPVLPAQVPTTMFGL